MGIDNENSKPSILAIDDDIIMLSMIEDAFAAQYNIFAVTSGVIALIVLSVKDISLILLDIEIPGMDGFEILRQIREQECGQEIPVIMLTGDNSLEAIKKGFDLGINDFVIKPVNMEELQRRMEKHMTVFFEQQELRRKLEKEHIKIEDVKKRLLLLTSSVYDIFIDVNMETMEYCIFSFSDKECTLPLADGDNYKKAFGQFLKEYNFVEDIIGLIQNLSPESLQKALQSGKKTTEEISFRMNLPAGTKWYKARTLFITDEEIWHAYIMLRDATAEVEQQNKLHYDFLTGLLNKETFIERATEYFSNNGIGAIMVIDMDDLKYVNDTFGHLAGDQALLDLADTIKKCFSGYALAGHLSGDEFAVAIPGLNDHQTLGEIAAHFLEKVALTVTVPDKSRMLTASLGIAVAPEHGNNFTVLFEKADRAVIYVKNHGRNNYRIYERRDYLQEEAKGRNKITFSNPHQLLACRSSEQQQIWVKFGEFRLLWHTCQQLFPAVQETMQIILFTIRALDDNQNINFMTIINNRLTEFVKEQQFSGIFSWYSTNEFFLMTNSVPGLFTRIDKVLQHKKPELIDFGFKINYQALS